jgi:hypothetical protein
MRAASVDAEIIGHKQKKKLAIEQLDQLQPDRVMSILLALNAPRDDRRLLPTGSPG